MWPARAISMILTDREDGRSMTTSSMVRSRISLMRET
jgi:hypothetical protein